MAINGRLGPHIAQYEVHGNIVHYLHDIKTKQFTMSCKFIHSVDKPRLNFEKKAIAVIGLSYVEK